jgi:hypothetical protein
VCCLCSDESFFADASLSSEMVSRRATHAEDKRRAKLVALVARRAELVSRSEADAARARAAETDRTAGEVLAAAHDTNGKGAGAGAGVPVDASHGSPVGSARRSSGGGAGPGSTGADAESVAAAALSNVREKAAAMIEVERRRVAKMEQRQKKELAALLAAELTRAQLEEDQTRVLAKKINHIEEQEEARRRRKQQWDEHNVRRLSTTMTHTDAFHLSRSSPLSLTFCSDRLASCLSA